MEKSSEKALGWGVVGWELLSFFPFSHTQGDLPSYTSEDSEDKSPLGTQLTNTVWSDVVLDLCLEGCSSWWQSRRGDGSIAFCSVCCVTPSRPYALCSPSATLLPSHQSALSTTYNSWRCCCGHIKSHINKTGYSESVEVGHWYSLLG